MITRSNDYAERRFLSRAARSSLQICTARNPTAHQGGANAQQPVGLGLKLMLVLNCSPKLKADLVISLSSGTMGYSISSNLLRDLDLALGNQRSCNGGPQHIDSLIQGVSPEGKQHGRF